MWRLFSLLTCAAMVLTFVTRSDGALTVEVNKAGAGGAFTTIQAAVDSGALEIIITDSETYVENVRLGSPELGGPPMTLRSTKKGDERPVITPAEYTAYAEVQRTPPDRGAGVGVFANGSVIKDLILEGNADLGFPGMPDVDPPIAAQANGIGALLVMADNVIIEGCLFRPAADTQGRINNPNALLFFAQEGAGQVPTPDGRDGDGSLVRNCEFNGCATDAVLEPNATEQGFLVQGGNGQTSILVRCDHFGDGRQVTITFDGCYFHHSYDAGVFPSNRGSITTEAEIKWVVKNSRFDAFGKFALRGRGVSLDVEGCVFTRTNQTNNGDGENSAVAIQMQDSHKPDANVFNCVFVNGGSSNATRAYYAGVNNHNAGLLTVDRCTFVDCLSGAVVGTGGGDAGTQTIVKNSIFHRIGYNSIPAVDNTGLALADNVFVVDGLYEAWLYGLPVNSGHFQAPSHFAAVFNNFNSPDGETSPNIVVEDCLVGDIAAEDDRPWPEVLAADVNDPANVLGARLSCGFTEGTTVFGLDSVTRGTPIFLNTDPEAPNPYALAPNSPGQGKGAFIARGGSQQPIDCNQDGQRDISDAVCLLSHLFQGTPATLPCEGGTVNDPGNLTLFDANGDQGIDISDAVYFLSFQFGGGPPPVLGVDCTVVAGCPEKCVQ